MGGSQGENFGVRHCRPFQVIQHVLTLCVLEPDFSLMGVLTCANQSTQQGESFGILSYWAIEISKNIDVRTSKSSYRLPHRHLLHPEISHHRLQGWRRLVPRVSKTRMPVNVPLSLLSSVAKYFRKSFPKVDHCQGKLGS